MVEEKKTFIKKSINIILVPSQRYQDSRHILQNPKVPRNVMGFSNRAKTFTPLNYLSSDSHESMWLKIKLFYRGAVYIQIIRSSKFLCAITEAHDIVRNCWFYKRCLESWCLWLGTKTIVCFFCKCFIIYHFILNFLPQMWHL